MPEARGKGKELMRMIIAIIGRHPISRELAGYLGRILVMDADPVMTLHIALGYDEPEATLAAVRDSLTGLDAGQVRELPGGVGQYAIGQLQQLQALSKRRIRTSHYPTFFNRTRILTDEHRLFSIKA